MVVVTAETVESTSESSGVDAVVLAVVVESEGGVLSWICRRGRCISMAAVAVTISPRQATAAREYQCFFFAERGSWWVR